MAENGTNKVKYLYCKFCGATRAFTKVATGTIGRNNERRPVSFYLDENNHIQHEEQKK
jgi:hypothetical protein